MMDLSIKNANHERVMAIMDKCIKQRYKNICGCQRCVNDIAAIALNYLPPHYYVEIDKNKEVGSPWVMVEAAVYEAIDRVIENPNHHHPFIEHRRNQQEYDDSNVHTS